MKDRAYRIANTLVGLKRFLVFAPGIILFLLAFYFLFPSLNNRLPASLAVFMLYVLTAYITVPILHRAYRIFRPSTHLPRYSVTPDGFACDPVNIAIAGTKQELVDAMTKAGWYQADDRTVRTMFKLVLSSILRRQYVHAPFSSLYLFGRAQDIGFQKPFNGSRSPDNRHHVRFWACVPAMMTGKDLEHADFWQKLYPDVDKGEVLWVGCASRDIGIAPITHNFQLTHRVHEKTDEERELIVKDLQTTHQVEEVRYVTSGEPITLKNRALNSSLSSDGTLAVIDLK